MNRIAIIITIGFLALTTICQAQPPGREQPNQRGQQGPPSVEEIFKMDKNKDGKLSKSEIKGPLKKDFAKVDTNKDGFITREEFKKAPKPAKGQRPPRQ